MIRQILMTRLGVAANGKNAALTMVLAPLTKVAVLKMATVALKTVTAVPVIAAQVLARKPVGLVPS